MYSLWWRNITISESITPKAMSVIPGDVLAQGAGKEKPRTARERYGDKVSVGPGGREGSNTCIIGQDRGIFRDDLWQEGSQSGVFGARYCAIYSRPKCWFVWWSFNSKTGKKKAARSERVLVNENRPLITGIAWSASGILSVTLRAMPSMMEIRNRESMMLCLARTVLLPDAISFLTCFSISGSLGRLSRRASVLRDASEYTAIDSPNIMLSEVTTVSVTETTAFGKLWPTAPAAAASATQIKKTTRFPKVLFI